MEDIQISNLASLLDAHLATPERVLYSQWDGETWRNYSAGEVALMAARWQAAFRRHGFEKGDRVALCLKNGVHWAAIDLAALGLGLVVVPLYVSDNPENVAWCVANSDARLLVLENGRILEGLQLALAKMPEVVSLLPDPPAPAIGADQWLPESGDGFTVLELERDALATIVYTSGTAGRPKGVKLSHRNILANVEAVLKRVPVLEQDLMLSILPLSHMFERTCGYYTPLRAGIPVAYCRGVNQLGEDLAFHRPTILIAVPRVFERFLAKIEQGLAKSPVRRTLFHLAVGLGWRLRNGRAGPAEKLLGRPLARKVSAAILDKLGGRLRLAVVGGAKVEMRIAQTFMGLGLELIHGYGLSEASPVVAASHGEVDPASVGRPLDGLEVRLNEKRELLVRGPSVMQGYWRNPEATAAVLSQDGWLNTGDLAELRDERVYIRGRSKDILVLSNGEKFSPQEAEAAILDDELFDQVILAGEGRPFLTLLAVTGETDEKKVVRHANARLKAFPGYVRVRRAILLREPWTVDNGLLTPTLKVKREAVYRRYSGLIETVYNDN